MPFRSGELPTGIAIWTKTWELDRKPASLEHEASRRKLDSYFYVG